MPQQAPLRTIKNWRRYAKRSEIGDVPRITRGVYVLYREIRGSFEVSYIGVAGLKLGANSGVASRLRGHNRHKKDWSHFSVFEVHDNVTREEIRELEILLLGIFRDDQRIGLLNVQLGSSSLRKVRVGPHWEPLVASRKRRSSRR
jgi:hypothetical protein